MRNIMRAIARLLGLQTKPLGNPAQPTPTAGPAPQVLTTQAGNKRSAATTKPRKPSPARTPRKPKKEAVQPTTVAAKRGRKKSTAQTVATARPSKATGSKSKTPASKTRQHAK